jgi:hypothetical protein
VPRSGILLRRALLTVGAVVLADVLSSLTWLREGRVGARPLPPFGVQLDAEQEAVLARIETGDANPNRIAAFDRDLGWCVRPGAVSAAGDVHIQASGVRGLREYADLAPVGALRLACFGDSFTFGDEVQDSFTFQAFLESLAPSVEALNLGVPAYGTDQALLRLRRDGIHGARVVVVGLLLENIGRNVNRYRPLWTPRTLALFAKPRYVVEGGALVLVPQPFEEGRDFARAVRSGAVLGLLAEHEYWRDRPAVWTGRWSSIGRLAAGWFAYRARSPRRMWLDSGGEPRRVTLALLDAFRESALAQGAEHVLVLVFPMRKELAAFREAGRAYWSGLPDELAARGLDALDLAPALAEEDARCEQDPARPTLYVAEHFSSHGNLVVARAIERWLIAKKLL